GTPLEVSADAKYDYFYRNYGHTGHRFRVQPTVKLPMKNDFFSFIPSLGVDHTSYDLTRHEGTGNSTFVDYDGRSDTLDTNATKNGFQARTTWTAGFTAFSEMTRVFTLSEEVKAEPSLAGTSEWTRLKHSIIPRVKYSYTPTITGQDELPYFDKYDRITGQNRVTYSLTNVLDRRRDSVILSPGSGGEPQASVASDYLDFLIFRLEQSYDQNEADRKDELVTFKRRPFSDVMAELRIKPETFIDILTRTWFSPYLGDMTQSENTIRLYKDGLGEISVGYDFQEKINEYKRSRTERLSIVSLGGKWELNDEFTIGAKFRHDFNKEKDLERTVKLDWAGECYTLHFAFTQKTNDSRFEVGFDLFNF
ncbi:MAG: LPS assembly protein LptD, partial [Pseudodesulfovibrio sp.]|nr:LPS assembly protein LptD [Pseudodesulfovibrio sp.]